MVVRQLMVASLHGTGSYSPGLKGWQRPMCLMAVQPPFRKLYFSMAWYAQWEQGGKKHRAIAGLFLGEWLLSLL